MAAPTKHWICSEGNKSKADVQLGYYTQSETLLGDAELWLSFLTELSV